jgi:NADH-quinone oxidoreductase subunit G
LARLAEHIGTANIDHRITQRDFSDQDNDPLLPWLGCNIEDIETSDALLVAGSNLRKEVPIIAHRVRKAAIAGAKVCFANSDSYEYNFDVAEYAADGGLVEQLAGVAVAAAGSEKLPASIATLCKGIEASKAQKNIAATLSAAERPLVITGLIAARHNAAAAIRALASAIADMTGARVGTLTDGGNAAGAHLAGALPHRSAGGTASNKSGLHAGAMLDAPLDAMLLLGIEPDRDICSTDGAQDKLAAQNFVAALTPYQTEALEASADLLLPVGTFAETSGTFVNCETRWQSFSGVANPVGEARPAWKVLRVLGNLLDASNFEYQSSEEVRDELAAALGEIMPDNAYKGEKAIAGVNGADATAEQIDVPIYQVDGLVRRSTALQLTPEAKRTAGGRS